MEQPEYETEIMAFETYESESEFNRLHMTAPAVIKFLGAIDSDQLLGRPTSLNFLDFTGIGFHTRGEEREKEVKKSGKKPWTAVVSVVVKKSEDIEKLLSLLSPLAQFVTENEPNTLTYAVFRSKSNSNEVLIFERYVTRADLEDVHEKSSQFQTFAAKLGESGILQSKTTRTYEEQQVGIWGKE